MKSSRSYILVLGQATGDTGNLKGLLEQLRCSVAIADSSDQAFAHMRQALPFLVILAGNSEDWLQPLVQQLRTLAHTCGVTIVALTSSYAPSWLQQEENPGLDGFLVEPISSEILTSLVQSAWARQTYCSTG